MEEMVTERIPQAGGSKNRTSMDTVTEKTPHAIAGGSSSNILGH